MDLSKYSYEDFCKALYTCKTPAEVRALVKSDYGIELPKTGNRDEALRAAYEAVCKNKAPEASPEAPASPAVEPFGTDGAYKVRVKDPNLFTRGRAGMRFTRQFRTETLTAAQVVTISADPTLQIVKV